MLIFRYSVQMHENSCTVYPRLLIHAYLDDRQIIAPFYITWLASCFMNMFIGFIKSQVPTLLGQGFDERISKVKCQRRFIVCRCQWPPKLCWLATLSSRGCIWFENEFAPLMILVGSAYQKKESVPFAFASNFIMWGSLVGDPNCWSFGPKEHDSRNSMTGRSFTKYRWPGNRWLRREYSISLHRSW